MVAERNRRIEAEETVESLQAEYNQLKDSLEEVKVKTFYARPQTYL
jgi:ABC-type Fe3+-hydroxamate transport system substrate-binding protein